MIIQGFDNSLWCHTLIFIHKYPLIIKVFKIFIALITPKYK